MSLVSIKGPEGPTLKFIPFSLKTGFQEKIMVFQKIFLAEKKEKKKVTYYSAKEINLEYVF